MEVAMKRLILIFLVILNFGITQTIIDYNFISGSDTLKAVNSPYVSPSSVIIYAGATVVVEDSVEWQFYSNTELRVLGTLKTLGDSTRNIKFTLYDSTGQWSGIFLDESDSSIIKNSIIENASNGVKVDDDRNTDYPQVYNNEIRNCGNGINVDGNRDGRFYIESNIIHNNSNGIYTYHTEPIIKNNIITNNTSYGIYARSGLCGAWDLCNNSSPTIENNLISNNTS